MAGDILIRGGTIFDGSGAPGVPRDVLIRDGRIAAVGTPDELAGADASAAVTIDATARYVTPGFIDIHTHSDRTILINPRMESKLRQGVTTEAGGNCGAGVAPALGEAMQKPEQARDPGRALETRTWTSMDEYFAEIERGGIAGNYATWVGHGTLRASTVGYVMRAPSADEMAQMARLLRESMEAGAFGLSTGLIYVPSGYAELDEIATLAGVVRGYGGLYASHIRNESSGLLGAVTEAIEVGRRGGVPVQVAHHKAAGKGNWGLVQESLALMDRSRADGVDVACDQYPYVASSTGLSSILPTWALEGGGDALVARLSDESERDTIRRAMLETRPEWGGLIEGEGWHSIMIARCRSDRSMEGRLLGEVAGERGVDPFDLTFDLLAHNEGSIACVLFSMCEPDVRTVMQWSQTMIGSDASSVAPYGQLGEGKPHPRAYGTFARVLGEYVRALGILTWEAAIHKMTGQPAARMGLKGRGLLQPGAHADVVVFDPAAIADRATFLEPHRYAVGVEHVLVNGVPVIANSDHTGALPGRVLRRGAER